MPSFDIVSEVDIQEVDNAVNQARKEIANRYDFRGAKVQIEWDRKEIVLTADDDYRIKAIKDILQGKLHHRGIDIGALKFEDPYPAGGMLIKQKVTLVQGIEKETAKDIVKSIKDSKMKVQAQIMDDKVRVTSKSIDSLQECIAYVRKGGFKIPLQFSNMRS